MLGRIALLAVMLALGAFVAESLVEGSMDLVGAGGGEASSAPRGSGGFLVGNAEAVRGCEDWEVVCACEHPLDPNKPWPVQC